MNINELGRVNFSLKESYERTLNNCRFYEKENKPWSLMNEIGVLRGLMYAIEIYYASFDISEAMHFIELQQELRQNDSK